MFRSLATAASKSSRTGYPCWHGSQQAVDATIVNPVTRVGRLAQTCIPGGLPKRPLDAKATGQTYPELVRARLGGGRAAWVARWSGLLAVAAQRAIAAFQWELPVLIR